MKKLAFTLIFAVLVMVNVNAKEVYYTNGKVELTEKEYKYVVDFYGKDYLEKMTEEDYKWISEMDVNNREVKIKEVYDAGSLNQANPNGSFVQTSAKKLSISASCASDFCIVTTMLTWLGNPSVRSWDVMGARLYGTSLYNQNVETVLGNLTDTTFPSNYRFLSNGFGNSFKLPSGTGLTIQQRWYVKPGGRVYASYQHAMSNTTLAISKEYNISVSGYGSTFLFTGNAVGVYDGMVGVDMVL